MVGIRSRPLARNEKRKVNTRQQALRARVCVCMCVCVQSWVFALGGYSNFNHTTRMCTPAACTTLVAEFAGREKVCVGVFVKAC